MDWRTFCQRVLLFAVPAAFVVGLVALWPRHIR